MQLGFKLVVTFLFTSNLWSKLSLKLKFKRKDEVAISVTDLRT